MTIADDIRGERTRLVSTLSAAGPDAATLVTSWKTLDLASHLAGQDRFGGLPAFLARSAVQLTGLRFTAVYRDRPRLSVLVNGRTKPWSKSLEILARPAPDFVVRARVAPITLWELFVHHEDVRRPNALPREQVPNLDPVINWLVAYNVRRLPIDVRVQNRGGTTLIQAGDRITIEGSTSEAVLWLSGRDGGDLQFDGPPTEIDQLRGRLRV